MIIKEVEASKISPAPYNPRVDLQPGDEEYEKLKRSINEFGYVEPLIWNERTGNLVGGHQRYKVLMESNPKHLQVSVVHLSVEKEKALNIALNKISGQWDNDKLSILLMELEEADFDVSLTGFSIEDIERVMSDVPVDTQIEAVEDDGFDIDETLIELHQKEPDTKLGDVWLLGKHRLVCGDATKAEDIQKLIENQTVHLVVTDPPYNVAVKSDAKQLQEDGHGSIMNDDMSEEDFIGFLEGVFKQYAVVMDDKAAIYVFHPSSYQREFEDAMNKHNIVVRSQCVWVKNAPTFGWSQYRYMHEPIFYAFLKGQAPSWYGDRKQKTVWKAGLPLEEPLPESVWEVSRGDVSKYVHPTQKPLDLLAIPIANSSKRGDFIIDFFGGSGSTLMTADQMGRTCGLLELDPYFCDAIKKRYEKATGVKPELINREH